MYNSCVGSRVTWSSPFTQGYNNYDISYINDTPTSPVSSVPVSSSSPSVSQSNPAPNGNDDGWFSFDDYTPIFVIIALILIVGTVGGLFFYFKKKK
jgi:LPXTG-motif cell wall-anchored protein